MTATPADSTASAMRGVNIYWQQIPFSADGSHRRAVGGYWSRVGMLQLEFMKSMGLRPEHTLLDVGCGCLRGGIHFVDYLETERYFGVDINTSLLRAGCRELATAGLIHKNPRLLADPHFRFQRVVDHFDFGIAVSLFTHLYTNHIARCLVELRAVMSPASRFFASFFEAPQAHHPAPIIHQPGGMTSYSDRDPFHYSVEELAGLADSLGLVAERVGDWCHPRNQKMVCFRLQGD